MTQQQFQDSIAPFTNHGKSVAIKVPKGWRRVEASHPGKHFYIHMETSAITRFPKEIYDTKRETWLHKDGAKIPDEEIARDPIERSYSSMYPEVVSTAIVATQEKKPGVAEKKAAVVE